MPVPEQTPYVEYTANGLTKIFALTFDCDTEEGLIVKVDDEAVYSPTWSLVGTSVVFLTAPSNQSVVSIFRHTTLERETDYESFDDSLLPKTVNKDFDRIWWVLQELNILDTLLSARFEELKQLHLRENVFLELVASTSFAEPDIIFGLYVTQRSFRIYKSYPHIAYSDASQNIKVGLYKNDVLFADVDLLDGVGIFNIYDNDVGYIKFEQGDVLKFKLINFHYSVKNIAVTLIGKYPIYSLE